MARVLAALSWAIPLILAVLLFSVQGVELSPDGSLYMTLGLNLQKGLGYIDSAWNQYTFRGPVFPALLGMTFALFGASVQSALWLVRLFFVLNTLLVYWVGVRLAGKLAGFIAALLVLSSFVLHLSSARVHLDSVAPFFVLLSCLLVFIGFEQGRNIYLLLAGAVLGVAILTKDTAVLYVGLPFLLFLFTPQYRDRVRLRGILLFVMALLAIMLTWLVYVIYGAGSDRLVRTIGWVVSESLLPAQSAAPGGMKSATAIPFVGSLIRIAGQLWSRLATYYNVYFAQYFIFAPALIAAWLVVFYRSVRQRDHGAIWLSSMFILFSPLMLFLGQVQFRTGQNFLAFILSYLALAYAIVTVTRPFKYGLALALGMGLVFLTIQFSVGQTAFSRLVLDRPATGYLEGLNGTYAFSLGEPAWSVTGWHDPEVVEAAYWIRDNIPANDQILADWEWADTFYFALDGSRPIQQIQYLQSNSPTSLMEQAVSPVLFVWSQAGRTSPDRSMNNLLAFSETRFLNQVEETNTKYVIVGQRHNFLSIYLRANPAFKEVAQFNEGNISIFSVDTEAPTFSSGTSGLPLMGESRLRLYLANLRNMLTIDQYQTFLDGYFRGILGLTSTEITSLETGTEITFRVGEPAGSAKSALIFRDLGATALYDQTILYEKLVQHDLYSPWLRLSLGSLHQQNARYDDAALQYAASIDLAPTNLVLIGAIIDQLLSMPNAVANYFYASELGARLQTALGVAINTQPTQLDGYLLWATLLNDAGMPEEALAIATQALDKWPTEPKVIDQMFILYSVLNLPANIKVQMEQLIQADPALFYSILTTRPQSMALLSQEDRLNLLAEYIRHYPDEVWPRLMLGSSYLADAGSLEP